MPKVLLVHNHYQNRAGEDLSFEADRRLLKENSVRVVEYMRDNQELESAGPFDRLRIAIGTSWAPGAKSQVRRLIEEVRPDVVHFQNTFPLISPAPYWACRDAGIPVVQTIRNFRIFCAPGIFFRDGRICEDCVGKRVAWPGVVHACYRSSRSKTAPVAMMQTMHHWLRTWSRMVDAYVVPSFFLRTKLAETGLPAERIHVRPDVVDVDRDDGSEREEWGLYVGRLTVEKGVQTLIRAVTDVEGLNLKMAGTGPLENAIRNSLPPRIQFVGALTHRQTISLMRRARFVVVPSESYETFGRVVVEAGACETPVIAARIGALEEVVEHGVSGLQFRPGDAQDLATTLEWALAHPRDLKEMGRKGREVYAERYARGVAFAELMEIYELARTTSLES